MIIEPIKIVDNVFTEMYASSLNDRPMSISKIRSYIDLFLHTSHLIVINIHTCIIYKNKYTYTYNI